MLGNKVLDEFVMRILFSCSAESLILEMNLERKKSEANQEIVRKSDKFTSIFFLLDNLNLIIIINISRANQQN